MFVRLLDGEMVQQITGLFEAQLVHPVELIMFLKDEDCTSCETTQNLVGEIAALSPKITFRAYDIKQNPEIAEEYQVNFTPGIAILGRDGEKIIDYGIRFAGIPSGYEFSSFIQDVIQVSKADSGLKAEVREELQKIHQPIQLEVFVTPT